MMFAMVNWAELADAPQEIVTGWATLLQASSVMAYLVGGSICFRLVAPGFAEIVHALADWKRARRGIESNRPKAEPTINDE